LSPDFAPSLFGPSEDRDFSADLDSPDLDSPDLEPPDLESPDLESPACELESLEEAFSEDEPFDPPDSDELVLLGRESVT
jgi:hypothetical protein